MGVKWNHGGTQQQADDRRTAIHMHIRMCPVETHNDNLVARHKPRGAHGCPELAFAISQHGTGMKGGGGSGTGYMQGGGVGFTLLAISDYLCFRQRGDERGGGDQMATGAKGCWGGVAEGGGQYVVTWSASPCWLQQATCTKIRPSAFSQVLALFSITCQERKTQLVFLSTNRLAA